MAQVYVGTYAKYNTGSIQGAWLNLEDYSDREAFYLACAELHKDEADPELMFQDHEDIPDGMIGESWISPDVWEWLELSEHEQKVVQAYRQGVSADSTIEQALEAYAGTANSEEDYAQNYAEEIGALDENARWPNNCIDWERAARDLFMDLSGVYTDGTLYVFNNF